MAGGEYQSYTSFEHPQQGAFGRFLNLLGAVSSIGLVVGLGYWGYQLSMRDMRGVPVIRALEGPARVQPEDPGGQLADHQGLSVNRMQGGESSDVFANEFVLAPEPIDLDAQDLMLSDPGGDSDAIGATVSYDTDVELMPDHVSEALALAEKLAAGEDLASAVDEVESIELASLSATVSPGVPGVSISPRPASRPKFEQALVTPSAIEEAVAAAIEVKPEDIAKGARLVQLGIFDSREEAAQGWNAVSARFEEYIDGKSRVIEQASSGGRAFYRLRAHGFADLASSRRFCAVLVASNAPCIPVQFE